MKHRIYDIGPVTLRAVHDAVRDAVEYWPNAHLGADTPSDDIRAAFRYLRRRVAGGMTLYNAAQDLYADAQRYVDM